MSYADAGHTHRGSCVVHLTGLWDQMIFMMGHQPLIKGEALRTLRPVVGALLLNACAAQPQGLNLADVAAEDISRQSTAIYPTSPTQIRVAQSEPTLQAGLTPADQPFVNPPALAPAPVVTGTVGRSAGVPTLDSKANCRMAETLGIAQNADTCLLLENSARHQLVSRWAEFPSADRSHCVRYSTAGGGGTYTDLLTCLEMERTVKNLHSRNQSVARDQTEANAARASRD
jgi:hypothetical protein